MAKVLNQDISIGDNLRVLRCRAGLSQEKVASNLQILGYRISREIISQMELGKHNIRISILFALKEMYKATYEEIFDGVHVA